MNKLLSALLALGWIASGFTQTVDSSIGVDSPPADLPASPTTLVGGALSGNGTGGPPAWAVSKRSQNSRVWTRASQTVDASGKAVLQTNGSYTELATGLHFKDALGNWTDSLELVEIDDSPAGGAKAVHGPHRVHFPGDLRNGVVDIFTPGPNSDGMGTHLACRVLGLSYFDGTSSVLIAELTNCVGKLVGSNVVVYEHAFGKNLDADIRYTYRRSGVSQELLLHERPPDPAAVFGLNPQRARLQVLTEFLNTPDPTVARVSTNRASGLVDTGLNFGGTNGGMNTLRGTAFPVGGAQSTNQVQARYGWGQGPPVARSFQALNGRKFLVEEVLLSQLQPLLKDIAMIDHPAREVAAAGGALNRVSAQLLLPPVRRITRNTGPIEVAKAGGDTRPGVDVDWGLVDSGADGDSYEFATDQTYLISGDVYFNSYAQFDSSCYVKYTNNATINTPYVGGPTTGSPAILTCWTDDNWGEHITGSDGSCTRVNAVGLSINTESWAGLYNFVCQNLDTAVLYSEYDSGYGYNLDVENCSFINLNTALAQAWSCGFTIGLSYGVSFNNVVNEVSSIGVSYYTTPGQQTLDWYYYPSPFIPGPAAMLQAAVTVDSNNPPTDIILNWGTATGSASASWGADTFTGTTYMGPLPTTTTFTLAATPAALGLNGATITYMQLVYQGGLLAFCPDHAGPFGDANGDGIPDYLQGDTSDYSLYWQTFNSNYGLTGGNGLMVFTPLK